MNRETAELSFAQTYSIVTRIGAGQTPDTVARSMGLSLMKVTREAGRYGWPDRDVMRDNGLILARGSRAERARRRAAGVEQEATRLRAERGANTRPSAEPRSSAPVLTFLDKHHHLADTARRCCAELRHSQGLLVGSVACGACWEAAIRDDERSMLAATSSAMGVCLTCEAIA